MFHSTFPQPNKKQIPVRSPPTWERAGQEGGPDPRGSSDGLARHNGVYLVIWASHLCHPSGGWPPRQLCGHVGEPTSPWTDVRDQPAIRLPNNRKRNLPMAFLGAGPSFPGKARGLCATQRRCPGVLITSGAFLPMLLSGCRCGGPGKTGE